MRIYGALIELHIPASQSLKDKRKVVKGLIESIRSKFNVSISEVEFHDKWQRARIGIVWISTDGRGADAYFNEILATIDSRHGCERIGMDRFEY